MHDAILPKFGWGLTDWPCIYAANVNEDDLADQGASNDYVKKVREHAEKEGSGVTIISAQVAGPATSPPFSSTFWNKRDAHTPFSYT